MPEFYNQSPDLHRAGGWGLGTVLGAQATVVNVADKTPALTRLHHLRAQKQGTTSNTQAERSQLSHTPVVTSVIKMHKAEVLREALSQGDHLSKEAWK